MFRLERKRYQEVKKVLSIEFRDSNSPMVSNSIKMISTVCEHLIISKSDNFISLDATHANEEKILFFAKGLAETGFIKRFGIELVK